MDFNPNGWVDYQQEFEDQLAAMKDPFFSSAASFLSGSGKGKTVLLYKVLEEIAGFIPKPLQTRAPDCVSHACSFCLDTLKAVEIKTGDREEWLLRTACEPIYSNSRVIIGGNRLRGGGSLNIWGVKSLVQQGALLRQKYGRVDLTEYSSNRAITWGRQQLPKSLLDVSREFVINDYNLINNYEEARDAIANGYPIVVASSQGFSKRRDNEGFCAPQGTWRHSMAVVGVDDSYRRPGVAIQNSWPGYLSGGNRLDLPESAFWCDAEVFNRMCRYKDTYCMVDFNGYKKRKINTKVGW
jgi:hypothetical protein